MVILRSQNQITDLLVILACSVPQSLTAYHRASQRTTEPHSVPQSLTAYHRASQRTTEPHSVPQSLTVYHRASQRTTEPHSVPQSLTAYHRASQRTTEPHSVPQSLTAYHRATQRTTVTASGKINVTFVKLYWQLVPFRKFEVGIANAISNWSWNYWRDFLVEIGIF